MNNQPDSNPDLDTFLSTLAKALGKVSQERRDQELNEIRAHIVEHGQTYIVCGLEPDAAYLEAISQMGDPIKLGEKLTQEWKMETRKFRSRIWSAILMLALLGSVANQIIYLFQMSVFGDIYSPAVVKHLWMQLFIPLIALIVGSAGLCVPIALGIYLAKLMPKNSKPEAVVPPAVYCCLVFEVFKLIAFGVSSIWIGKRGLSVGGGYAMDAVLCLTAYVQMASRKLGQARPTMSEWKLRIG